MNARDAISGNTPLIWAANNNQLAAVKFLLANGARLNTRNNENQTALTCAVINGNFMVANVLLDRDNINPGVRDNDGRTVLDWATHKMDTCGKGDDREKGYSFLVGRITFMLGQSQPRTVLASPEASEGREEVARQTTPIRC